MPLDIMPATSPPAKEPKNSHNAPATMACRTVSALDPTDVPSAFDTSCAPMAHAIRPATAPLSISTLASMSSQAPHRRSDWPKLQYVSRAKVGRSRRARTIICR